MKIKSTLKTIVAVTVISVITLELLSKKKTAKANTVE